MRDILNRINRIPGVSGSLVVGPDGLLIASDLSGQEDPEELAAVASGVAATLASSLKRLNEEPFSRFVMNGSRGSVVLISVENANVLTLLRKDANMGMVLVELRDVARDLGSRLGA